jgi:hypothetical protein
MRECEGNKLPVVHGRRQQHRGKWIGEQFAVTVTGWRANHSGGHFQPMLTAFFFHS